MNAQEQIKKFHEFFEQFHSTELLESIRRGRNFFVVDFMELSRFDPELTELLLDQPEEVLTAAEIAVKEFDLPKGVNRFYVRVRNVPESRKIMVRDIRSKHLTKLYFQ